MNTILSSHKKVGKVISMLAISALAVSGFFVATSARAATTSVSDQTTLAAALLDNTVDTITFAGDISITTQMRINRPVIIDGQGHTLSATISDGTNSAFTIGSDNVSIQNLIEDGNHSAIHGINIYKAANVLLETVTVSNNGKSGVTVNGSNVTANSLNTSGNSWGAVNVDPGVGVTLPSVLTLNSGTLAESTQIWSDGRNVNTATVTVNATGYSMYKKAGTTAFFVWTNRPLTGVATITTSGITTFYSTIQAAINAATDGDTINIAAGTYDEQLVINGTSLNLVGAGDTTIIEPSSSSKLTALYTYPSGVLSSWVGVNLAPVILVENSENVAVSHLKVDGSNVASVPGSTRFSGILFGDSGGSISNVTVAAIKTTGYVNRTYAIDVSATGTTRSVEIANNTISDYGRTGIQVQGVSLSANIHNNIITGPGHITAQVPNGIVFIHGVAGNAIANTIHSLWYDDPIYESYGIMVYDPVTPGIVLQQNEVYDTQQGIGMSTNANDVTVQQNNLHDNGVGVHLEGGATGNTITNNTIINNTVAGIRLNGPDPGDIPGTGNSADNNTISGNTVAVKNLDTTQTFTVGNSWWGSTTPDFTALFSGSVTVPTDWYVNPSRTVLQSQTSSGSVDSTTGNFDVVGSAGQAEIPSGITNITLGDDTTLDLSASVQVVPPETVSIGGNSVDLAKSVVLQSGTDTEPIVLTNTNLDNISVSIPDATTIKGPSGWLGEIKPPVSETASGTAPAGFSVGSTVISIGSDAGTLVFDQPVVILLAGVTGPVGYRPAGSSTWIQISNACDGHFDNPGNPPLNGECYTQNSTDTKILTYHFTTFGSLVQTTLPGPNVGAGGGGGGGGAPAPAPAPAPVTPGPVAVVPTPTVTPPGQVLGAITFANGTLVKSADSGTVYLVVDGKLRPFHTAATFRARGLKFSDIQIISSDLVTPENIGRIVGYPDGTVIKGKGPTLYVVSGDTKKGITSMAQFRKMKLSLKKVVRLSDAELASYDDGGIAE